MPVTIVVGGQYGSEGKGKVAHWLARNQGANHAIRVGGPNSGHTVVVGGRRVVLRHLPTPLLCDGVTGIIPPGAYLDADVLLDEIEELRIPVDGLMIDPCAVVIDDSMKLREREEGLVERVASTGQGVGGAVAERAMRRPSLKFACDVKPLRRYVQPDLDRVLHDALTRNERVVVEGTQGFGLSILHGGNYPFATSRDTTAAGVLSEAGLSPRDVDCVALTLRAFPIRVEGNSGPLPMETTWEEVMHLSGANTPLTEFTTVTGRARRVAWFDAAVVLRAIRANRPDLVFLNHADYFDYSVHEKLGLTPRVRRAVSEIERHLGVNIDHLGTGPSCNVRRPRSGWYENPCPTEVPVSSGPTWRTSANGN